MVVQKDEIRSKIIDVAAKIFTRFGYRKTTMEEIAQAANKGKSSIYYYYPSKEDIFRAVVEKEAEELKKDLETAVSRLADPIEQLKTYILFRMYKMKTLTNFYAALKSDDLGHLEFIERIRRDYDRREVKVVTSILQEGMDKKKFVIDDPELAAVALVTAMKGLEIPLFIKKEHGNIEARLDNLIQFLFYGLVKR
ncbi:MAG: TetR/AcrR family transcriptional regulator [Bacteroidales bacterium]|nr:TetR/AcrR family transcriptional regulator [Bacteroidales bacterium]